MNMDDLAQRIAEQEVSRIGERVMVKRLGAPWAVRVGQGKYAYEVVGKNSRGGDTVVARIAGGPDYREGNAHLIAAAPDLLEALEKVRAIIAEAAMTGFQWHQGDWVERLYASQRDSSAAIKKATGGAE